MKLQSFLRFYFPVIILGVVYTALAALHACAEGRCWSGIGQGFSFSIIVAGLAYTQVLPGFWMFAYVGLHVYHRDKVWKEFMEKGWAMRTATVMRIQWYLHSPLQQLACPFGAWLLSEPVP